MSVLNGKTHNLHKGKYDGSTMSPVAKNI